MAKFQFRPTSMTVNCPVLKKLTLYGVSTLAGSLDLARAPKLEEVDLRGTGLSSVLFPETTTLRTAYLPSLKNIKLVNCPNLSELNFASLAEVISLTTDRDNLTLDVLSNSAVLREIHLVNALIELEVQSMSDLLFNALINENSTCSGKIKLAKTLTIEEKNKLINKYGNTDNPLGSLYVQYNIISADSASIVAPARVPWGGDITATLDYDGNDISSYSWEVTGAARYSATFDKVVVYAPASGYEPIHIKCTITRVDGSTIVAEQDVAVIAPIYISEIHIANTEMNQYSDNIVHISYVPADYTVQPNVIAVEMAVNDYVAVLSNDNEGVQFRLKQGVTDTIAPVDVIIKVTDVEGNQFSDSAKIFVTNPVTDFLVNGIKITE